MYTRCKRILWAGFRRRYVPVLDSPLSFCVHAHQSACPARLDALKWKSVFWAAASSSLARSLSLSLSVALHAPWPENPMQASHCSPKSLAISRSRSSNCITLGSIRLNTQRWRRRRREKNGWRARMHTSAVQLHRPFYLNGCYGYGWFLGECINRGAF